MRANPFHYGTPVAGDHFTGRETELETLVGRMSNGINVVLMSPRRYGKTSLHRAAQDSLTATRPAGAVIEVNVLRTPTMSSFVGALAARAFKLPGTRWARASHAVPEFFRRLRVAPTVTFDTAGNPRFGFDTSLTTRDAEGVIADVYGILEEVAARRPAALILDEFQAITRHGNHLPDLFKALADDHPSVSLIVAGSKQHLMEELVSKRHAPLYGMAQRLALGPIPEEAMISYLVRRSESGGRPMSHEVAQRLVTMAGPVPNDIQHLAFDAYECAGEGAREGASVEIDESALEAGMARAVAHEADLFAEAIGRFSPGQARVLTALAEGPPDEPYSAEFARHVGLASASSVRKALSPLLANEDVVERGGRLYLADPFFAAWLRPGSGY